VAARRCSICTHPDRPSIDMAMANHKAFRAISRQFNVSKDAALRHHDEHLPEMLAKAYEAEETARADDLLEQVKALRSKSLSILLAAEKAGDLRTALAGVRTALACLELLGELSQAIDRRPVVNLLLAPEWLAVRSTLIRALERYPEARRAVVASLVQLEAPA
jgi:hypothetical protein